MAKVQMIKGTPKDLHTVTPALSVDGGAKAVEFYKKVFNAKEIRKREQNSEGKIIHARMKIGDSVIMLSDRFSPRTSNANYKSPVTLHVYVDNVDKVWKNAISAGATIEMPIGNMFWGERYGQFTDPFGQRWSISTRIKMSKKELDIQRRQALKMFEKRK